MVRVAESFAFRRPKLKFIKVTASLLAQGIVTEGPRRGTRLGERSV
jgi:hypothetical protein